MILLGIIGFIALVLMVTGYWIRRPAIGIASGAMWWLAAAQTYTLSTAMWDVPFALYVLFIGLGIVGYLEGFALKPKVDKQIDAGEQMFDEEDDEYWTQWQRKKDVFQKRLDVRRIRSNKN